MATLFRSPHFTRPHSWTPSSVAALTAVIGGALTLIGGGAAPVGVPHGPNPVLAVSKVASTLAASGVWQSNLTLYTIPPTPFTPWAGFQNNPVLKVSQLATYPFVMGGDNAIIGGGAAPVGAPHGPNPVLRVSAVAAQAAWPNSWQSNLTPTTIPPKPFVPPEWTLNNPRLRVSQIATYPFAMGGDNVIIGGGAKPFFPFMGFQNNPVLRVERSWNRWNYPPNVTIVIAPPTPTCVDAVFSIMRNTVVPDTGTMSNLPVGVEADLC